MCVDYLASVIVYLVDQYDYAYAGCQSLCDVNYINKYVRGFSELQKVKEFANPKLLNWNRMDWFQDFGIRHS